MPVHGTRGKKRIVLVESDDNDLEEETAPLPVNQARVKRKQSTPKKKKPKNKEANVDDDEDTLNGFIVQEEEDIDDEMDFIKEKPKTRTRKTKQEKPASSQKVEKRKVSGAYRPRWLGPERDPPKHGSKPIPIGKPDCLLNIPFVLTGLNESLTRDETTELITKYGGLIRTAVSGKTKFLVAGFEMEDGRPITEGSKYKAALAKGVTIINEDQLLEMIRKSNPEGSAKEEAKQIIAIQKVENTVMKQEESIMEHHQPKSQSRLLTVKYAPSNSQEIIGNKTVIDNLRLWLQQWEDVIIHQTVIVQHNRQNPSARAALLSGPPGIGKTTSAHVLGEECGYKWIELNASDKRNMSEIRKALQDVVFTKTLEQKKRLIIMDEVDGMSTGDRGGIAELSKIIKTSLVPIICICNDRESTKVRSLTSLCYDLTFSKPSTSDITNRLVYICKQEGIRASKEELSQLVDATNGDIRQCLNKLQILSSVPTQEMALSVFAQDKFMDQTAFEVAKHMLVETAKYSLNERYNMFFNDYTLTPLVIEQNYLDSIKSKRYREETTLEVMCDAADSLCDLELLQNALIKNNNWKLLPSTACMTIRTGFKAAGSYVFTKFPAFYGKLSKMKKSRRLMNDFFIHLSTHMSGTIRSISQDYYETLSHYLMDPLLDANVEKCIQRLDEYSLTRDDLVETLNYTPLGGEKTLFETVPSKVKASLTRKYANHNHSSTNIFRKDEDLFSVAKSKKRNASESKKSSKKVNVEEEVISTDDDMYYVF